MKDRGGLIAAIRTSKVTIVLRLFAISLTCMIGTSASAAIIPSLMDRIYVDHYAENRSQCLSNQTSADSICSFPQKNFLLGLFMSYTPLIEVALTPLVPFLITSLGVRNSILISALVKLFGCLLTTQATSLTILFIGRFLHGLPVFVSLTAGLAATCHQYGDNEDQRSLALALGLQGMVVGNLIAYFIGSTVYQLLGILPAFMILAVFHVAEIVISFVAKNSSTETKENVRVGWCSILGDLEMVISFVCTIHAFHYFTAWRTIKPEWMYTLGATTMEIGAILAGGTILQLVISTSIERTRLSHWGKVLTGQIVSVLGIATLPFTSFDFWYSIIPDVSILLGYSLTISCLGAFIAERAELVLTTKAYVVVYTIFIIQTNIGSTTGGFYAGALNQSLGFQWTCFITASVSLVLTVFIVIWMVRRKRSEYGQLE